MSSAEIEGIPGARPGDILNGKYRVEKVLGAGGMGVVVAAMHLELDEKVAIKFLLPEAAKSADTVSRFEREAKAAVKIKSEHVARVRDVGKLENGAPFMVMEFLHGRDLAETVEQQGGLPVQAAVEYILQACEALAEAHAAGIVHRDLKPANLFLTSRADGSPCIKVLDFGISKMVGSLSMPGMTKTTAVMGSPLYMSPEQMKSSKDVDHRTDIWSLGAILYELLSGSPPFIADTMPQLCLMILQEPLPPLAQVRNDVPPQLEAVIRRCQEKDANLRFQNVAELAAALAPFVQGRARLSAERVADVLRTASTSRPSFNAMGATPTPPPAYAPPGPTVAGAPYGLTGPSHSPSHSPSMPYGAPPGPYGAQAQTGGNFAAQGQTGGNFGSQSNPNMMAGATVVGAPNMMAPGMAPPGHHPHMGASTASSWEGQMGAPKKKGSAGVIIGVIAGVAVIAGIGIAALALSKGGKAAAASDSLNVPTSAQDVKPGGLVPTVTVAGDAPPSTATAAASTPEPTPIAAQPSQPVKTGGKPSGKPTTTASATASATATAAPTVTKPSHGGLDDDRK
jgi:serine/threonine-protein kinase